jgi:predicted nuclease of predicted toxin-antitoxin system
MKFIIDEQLPTLLSEWLNSKGYDAIHVLTLGTDKPIPDHVISALSMAEQRIVITKDADFFDSFILYRKPYKLIFVTTGNIKNRALLDLFRAEFQTMLSFLSKNNLIEVSNQHIKVWL